MVTRLTMYAAACYRIRIQGLLGQTWLEWCGPDLVIKPDVDDPTGTVAVLTVQKCDQAALLGLLNSLYEANIPLLSVEHLQPTEETER